MVQRMLQRGCARTAALVLIVAAGCTQQPAVTTAPGTSAPVAPGVASLPPVQPVATTAVVNSAQNEANKAQYEQSLAQASFEKAHTDLKKKYGDNRIAIVVVDGVPGPAADADHYLERKIFKAAWTEYEAGQQQARQATEANRKEAEQKAAAEHEQKWGSGFGPMTVWYRYKPVRSDVPYPEVRGGQLTPGRHVYYAGPVTDLAAFTSRIKFGNVTGTDASQRTVTVQSFIPVPIPDIDEEELLIQHGKESVLTVEISGAAGDSDRVTYFIEQQIRDMPGGKGVTLVGPRFKGDGNYRMVVAPVSNLGEFAAKIGFGSIADLNESTRILKIAAKLPADLPARPTAAELAELQRQERMGDDAPKPGESEIDWALRVMKKADTSWSVKKVLKALATAKVDSGRLEEVADVLVDYGTTSTWAWHNQEDLLPAMDNWFSDKTGRYLSRLLSENSWDRKKILSILAQHPSDEAARSVAQLMTDRQLALDASAALRDMGPAAEETVYKLAQDRFPSMRVEAYDILRVIGTSKSLSRLKSLQSKEKDKDARDALKSAIQGLEERLAESGDTTAAPAKKK